MSAKSATANNFITIENNKKKIYIYIKKAVPNVQITKKKQKQLDK